VSGVLIAGPARCGKSTLVQNISNESNFSILSVDTLLPAFRKIVLPKTIKGRKKFLDDYFARPRYMDPAKQVVRCPANDIGDYLEDVVAKVEHINSSAATNMIIAALDSWASEANKGAWIAPDLHAEIYFDEFSRENINLRMIVLLRDPREAIAASLYWRTYPQRCTGSRKVFIYRLLLWCLAAHVGHRLQNEMPDRVRVVFVDSFDEISSKDDISLLQNLKCSDIQNIDIESMYFNYVDNQGWLCPDGDRKYLLTKYETNLIEHLCQQWTTLSAKPNKCGINFKLSLIGVRALLNFILVLSWFNAGMAKSSIDWLFFPVKSLRRTFYGFIRILLGQPLIKTMYGKVKIFLK